MLAAEKKRRTDFDDLQNEQADRETGRARKYYPRDHDGSQSAKAKEERYLSALKRMLQNETYLALYNQTDDLLTKAETATEKMLPQAEQQSRRDDEALDDMLEKANKLPDGTAVFRDKDGNIYTEDGGLIEAAEAESIVWKDNAPTYEDYRKQKQDAEKSRQQVEDIRRYQVDVLGNARERLHDENNPLSPEELKEMQQEVKGQAPALVAPELAPDMSSTDTRAVPSGNIVKPVL